MPVPSVPSNVSVSVEVRSVVLRTLARRGLHGTALQHNRNKDIDNGG